MDALYDAVNNELSNEISAIRTDFETELNSVETDIQSKLNNWYSSGSDTNSV